MKIYKRVTAVVWMMAILGILITENQENDLHTHRREVRPPTLAMMPIREEPETVELLTTWCIETPTDYEIDLLVRCVYAEAGNQPEEGIRAVVDVIRNRVNDTRFPDSIEGVITAQDQFAVYTFGSMWLVEVTQDKIDLVLDEWMTDTPVLSEEYIYFNGLPIGSEPYIVIGGHYFGT